MIYPKCKKNALVYFLLNSDYMESKVYMISLTSLIDAESRIIWLSFGI